MNGSQIQPVCPVFGECGGCQYQEISYPEELLLKERSLREMFGKTIKAPGVVWERIVPSPREYHYRSRLDLKFLKMKKGGTCMGFSPKGRSRLVEISACPLAMKPISDFLPELKRRATERLPPEYRNANLVVKTGDDGRVLWGGIGRRSLRLPQEDYLWTEVLGRRIFYSLDTFFQANLSILDALVRRIRAMDFWNAQTVLYDLYGGVGLFGLGLYDLVREVVLIEENKYAIETAQWNKAYHRVKNFKITAGRVEEEFPRLPADTHLGKAAGIIDPPRSGLGNAAEGLAAALRRLEHLLYLSCDPESLARDLSAFQPAGWRIERIMPFDFFPRTRHLETLVHLRRL